MFKDEGPYLDDWLRFHFGAGVDHFLLFDDSSADHSREILKPWVESGIVSLYPSNGLPQRKLYTMGLKHVRRRAQWLAFIDLDEYLFSPTGRDLTEVLSGFKGESAVFVYWHLFGSGGIEVAPSLPVPLAFTRCLPLTMQFDDSFNHGTATDKSDYVTAWSLDGKSIVRPQMVIEQGVHKPIRLRRGRLVNERLNLAIQRTREGEPSADLLRINHYWSRSLEELRNKVLRGSVSDPRRPPRDLQRWLEREAQLNRVTDTTLADLWEVFIEKSNIRGAPRPTPLEYQPAN